MQITPKKKRISVHAAKRGDLDGIAELLQTGEEAPGLNGLGAAIEVVGTKVVIVGAVLEHVVGGVRIEAGTAQIAFFAPRRARKRRNCLEIATVFAGGRPGALDQRGF